VSFRVFLKYFFQKTRCSTYLYFTTYKKYNVQNLAKNVDNFAVVVLTKYLCFLSYSSQRIFTKNDTKKQKVV